MTLTDRLFAAIEEKINDQGFRDRLNATLIQPLHDNAKIRTVLLHYLWPVLALQLFTFILVLALVLMHMATRLTPV